MRVPLVQGTGRWIVVFVWRLVVPIRAAPQVPVLGSVATVLVYTTYQP